MASDPSIDSPAGESPAGESPAGESPAGESPAAGGGWTRHLPTRAGWLGLLAAPTSYALTACWLATVAVKLSILRGIEEVGAWPITLLWCVSLDAAFYLGFAAMFAVGEGKSPRMRFATYPLTLLITFIAAVNCWYLSVTGTQLSWEIVSVGADRIADAWSIGFEGIGEHKLRTFAILLIAVGIPVLVHWYHRRRDRLTPVGAGHPERPSEASESKGGTESRRLAAHARARCAVAIALPGLLIAIFAPRPLSLPAQELGANAVLHTYWTFLTEPTPEATDSDEVTPFYGYDPAYLVPSWEIDALRARARPNVIILLLESTRFDHTSLVTGPANRGTETPHLAALAARGLSATRAHAVLPHTTKSMVSVLCGRYPAMQQQIIELSRNFVSQCLPWILGAGGYRTAFFQSAWGVFEQRPRLVERFGYQEFKAWEDLQGEPLGYLASDDESLGPPTLEWIDQVGREGKPFFLTLVTSATHHPYRLSKVAAERARTQGKPTATDEQRYARLIEAMDYLLGALVAGLEERGLLDDTIIVAFGDHGEGFGAKGIRQHDNNFYEEGLHVPLVIAGPRVPVRQIDELVTLGDVTPTLLGLLGTQIAPEAAGTLAGVDLLTGPTKDRSIYFTCWFDLRCRGVLRGTDKIVFNPELRRAIYFDLATDPQEQRARRVPKQLEPLIDDMHRVIDRHRNPHWPVRLGPVPPSYAPWRCDPGRPCIHPNAREIVIEEE